MKRWLIGWLVVRSTYLPRFVGAPPSACPPRWIGCLFFSSDFFPGLYRGGSRDVVSIVMSEVDDHAKAYAIVVGTAGHTEVRRYDEENRTWVTCDDR